MTDAKKNDQQHVHQENVDKIEQRTQPLLEMVRVIEQNRAKAVRIVRKKEDDGKELRCRTQAG